MHRYLVVLLGFVLLPGCNDDDVSPEQALLDQNQSKWANANMSDYTFTVGRTCFCPIEEPIVVSVSNNIVISAFFTPSGVMLEDDRTARTRTIDDYFALVQTGLDENYETLEVSYNADFGFPELISIDESLQIADEEIIYRLQDFQ